MNKLLNKNDLLNKKNEETVQQREEIKLLF
jgi:hypothetical protein